MAMEKLVLDRMTSLRQQSKEQFREGYDGHNKRSGIVTMDEIGHRRTRRRWNCYMRRTVLDWNMRMRIFMFPPPLTLTRENFVFPKT